ncbi:MAG: NYN domain-containing protein, partial [Betaproteobacteria bacterium]|nr:NYN domain-containing protein [Betaproteobacteria bacterium]
AVFYDGAYFFKVSSYYVYQHERRARLSFRGVHDFIISEIAQREGISPSRCQIVDAAYFQGRLTAQQAADQDRLFSDRVFEDALTRADIALYQQHLAFRPDGTFEEKRIDVWLALEAYEMTSLKNYDVCVLITGDGDFVPLVRKLNTLGARVMLLGWEFEYEREDGRTMRTQVSTGLIDRVNYPVLMKPLIDDRARRHDPLIDSLFLPQSTQGEWEWRSPHRENGHRTLPADFVEGVECQGTIVNLIAGKGYGFIKPAAGSDNYFFHASDLIDIGIDGLRYDDKVLFVTARGEKGIVAKNVRLSPDHDDDDEEDYDSDDDCDDMEEHDAIPARA